MRTLDSKTFNGNFEITLVKKTGKRRIPHSKQWREVTVTETNVKGLENVDFFMYNDYGDRSVSFSLDVLNESEIELLKSKISGDTSKYDEMGPGEKEARLFDDSGLSEELAKAYTEWYGVEVRG